MDAVIAGWTFHQWYMADANRSVTIGRISLASNALASSIVLVCRQRPDDAPTVSRREFIRELNAALPDALDEMTRGGVNSPVAPVDLSQAIIGPGMAIFSKYKAVLEADGSPMSVRTALTLINRFFAEDDFDHDTQFCLHWFDNSGWAVGKFGEADVLARAKGTAVDGLVQAGVVESSGGKLRLFRWAEYPADWAPERIAELRYGRRCTNSFVRSISRATQPPAGYSPACQRRRSPSGHSRIASIRFANGRAGQRMRVRTTN